MRGIRAGVKVEIVEEIARTSLIILDQIVRDARSISQNTVNERQTSRDDKSSSHGGDGDGERVTKKMECTRWRTATN
jgi:hypothetical protein